MSLLSMYQGFIFDLDGTIYLGERLLPYAKELLFALSLQEKPYVFLTNKPLATRAQYQETLSRLGIPAKEEQIITSSSVMAYYLSNYAPCSLLYVIGEPPLKEELRMKGLSIIEEPETLDYAVDYVVLAFDRDFHYDKLNRAYQAVKKGATILATNSDKTCPVEGGEVPDAAGMIGALEGVTGQRPQLIVGKPNRMVLEQALKILQTPLQKTLMVGDRLETDILMGREAGMDTALVLTGITKSKDPIDSYTPTYVLPTLASFFDERDEEKD